MRIGIYQFRACYDIGRNYDRITAAVREAASKGARLLVFPECALTGYPPLETPSVLGIDTEFAALCLDGIRRLAAENGIYTAVGTVRREGGVYYNSMVLAAPDGGLDIYDKRALSGWDQENFKAGTSDGIFRIDGFTIGFRLCYEVRFPEYFRELFRKNAGLCVVSFCDIAEHEDKARYELIKAHLRMRAAENVMTVLSVNSVSDHQTAPSAVFNPDGGIEAESPADTEVLFYYDYEPAEPGFGAAGRQQHSHLLTNT